MVRRMLVYSVYDYRRLSVIGLWDRTDYLSSPSLSYLLSDTHEPTRSVLIRNVHVYVPTMTGAFC